MTPALISYKNKIMKKILTYALCAAAALSSCTDENLIEVETGLHGQVEAAFAENLPGNGIPGRICIKLKDGVQERVQISKQGEASINSVPSPMSAALTKLGARRMYKVFYSDPRFEKREKEAGLDRWFYVDIDNKYNLDYAIASLENIEELDIVEKVYQKEYYGHSTPTICQNLNNKDIKSDEMFFNDPGLKYQWHYQNFGTYSGSKKGADLNCFEAWEKEVGQSNVIVGVIDGGIYYQHEDLNDNMWINPGEIAGDGIDNDGNGKIDDVYGWNTCKNNGNIYADEAGHGTHVAGTIGARNNNNIGVCGVAGGDGTPTSGVRLMSCMIFGGRFEQGNSNMAFQYAANNGATITNNSWGYQYPGPKTLPASDKAAIDYFIKNAGCDKDGNQLPDSPMKGGIAVFAAGNDDKDFKAWPAAYHRTLSVSAMAPDWKRAWYSNRGDWVKVMAPGGDENYNKGEVYSTFPEIIDGRKTYKKYDYMQGTSMATPHVTGVCALVVSKYGGQGYTCDMLMKTMCSAFRPKNIDDVNPNYKGRLGAGYVDAARALDVDEKIAPNDIEKIEGKSSFVEVALSWKAVEDKDDKVPLKYIIYYSRNKFTADNLSGVTKIEIGASGYNPGETVKHVVKNLSTSTEYYFGVQAEDRWGHRSNMTMANFTTKKNNPPVFSDVPEELIRLEGIEMHEFDVHVADPDGHRVRVKFSGETRGVTTKYKAGTCHIKIRATAPVGMHKIVITALDEFDDFAKVEIPFEIYVYKAPFVKDSFNDQLLGIDQGEQQIDLKKYFGYEPDQKVDYTLTFSEKDVLSASIDGTVLKYKGVKSGLTKMTVTLDDHKSRPLSLSCNINVVPDSKAMVYECDTKVTNSLNIFMNPTIQKADVIIRSVQGNTVFDKTVKPAVNGGRIKIGMKKVAIGTYKLIIKSNKGDYEKTFVKL